MVALPVSSSSGSEVLCLLRLAFLRATGVVVQTVLFSIHRGHEPPVELAQRLPLASQKAIYQDLDDTGHALLCTCHTQEASSCALVAAELVQVALQGIDSWYHWLLAVNP